jgi:ShK domain-like
MSFAAALRIAAWVAVLLILIIFIADWVAPEAPNPKLVVAPPLFHEKEPVDPRSFYELTDGEKVQYIVDTYFLGPDEQGGSPEEAQKAKDAKFIQSLPQDNTSCDDDFEGCAAWAQNGECTVNPEFMLYYCPKSCGACSMTPSQKYKAVQVYNRQPIDKCIFRGESYPDPGRFVRNLESVFNDPGIPI